MRERKCRPVFHCFTCLFVFISLQLLMSYFGRLSSQNIFHLGLEDANASSWNLDAAINCAWKLIRLLNWLCACLLNLYRVVSPPLEKVNNKNSQMGKSPLSNSNLIAFVLSNNIILALQYMGERWVILSARKPQVCPVFSWTKNYYTWTVLPSIASNKISSPPL